MWPWAHLAVGYLLYSGLVRLRTDRSPTGPEAMVLALATQLPDLVDKPLAWTVGVLPHGRSLAHSALVAAVVVAVVWAVARRARREELGAAFGVGYVSHLAADGLYPLLAGEYRDLAFLAWPLVPAPGSEAGRGVLAHFASIEPTPYVLAQTGLTLAALALWVSDGAPGVPAGSRATPPRHS